MKFNYISILFLFLLCSCTDNADSPIINVEKLFVNGDLTQNFAYDTDMMPVLSIGDEVEVILYLDGMGSELQTFQLDKDNELMTEINYAHSIVSNDANLTDEKNGRLRFKDGVMYTQLKVNATVQEIDTDNTVKLSFYLSSKAECETAQEIILFNLNLDTAIL